MNSARLLAAIWLGSSALALLSLFGMALLILRRLVIMRRAMLRRARHEALMQHVIAYLDGTEDLAAVAAAASDPEITAELIAAMRQLVRGEPRDKLCALADGLGVIDFALARLGHPQPRLRREAAAWLALGPAARVAPALERALDDRDYQVRLAAARALAELGAVREVADLAAKLGREAANYSGVLYHIFRQLVPALSDKLAALLHSDSPDLMKLLALDALGKSGDGRLVAPIARLAGHGTPEIRASALRALAELGYPEAGTAAREALADPAWRVRSQAARCLGRIGFTAAIPVLVARLGDDEWWVRYRAAEALYQLGEDGRRALAAAAMSAGRAARVSEMLLAEKDSAA